MTWGIYETSSFGSYLLDGEIEGHVEALKKYYDEVMTDAEREPFEKHGGRHLAYKYHVTDKLTREPGYSKEGYPPTGPVLSHEAPPVFRLAKKPAKGLSALVMAGYYAVSGTLKDKIEALEPGVHEFWPLRILLPRGEEWPEQFYTIRFGRYLDSFRPDESDEGSWYSNDGKNFTVDLPKKEKFAGLAMSKSAIGSAHLWKERAFAIPEICMSYEMRAAFVEAGFMGSKLFKLRDVP